MPPPPPRTNISEEERRRKQREALIRKEVEERMRIEEEITRREEEKMEREKERERMEEERKEKEREEERKRKEEEERSRKEADKAQRQAVKERLDNLAKELKQKGKFTTEIVKEITHRHIYALRDEKVFLMLPNFANDYLVSDDIKNRFMGYRLMRQEALSFLKIKRTAYKHLSFENTDLMYTVYEVRREDNRDYYFCDNDLLSINPVDLLVLGKAMKKKIKESGGELEKMSYQRILSCMKNFVNHKKQTDFQIGLNHQVENLSISAPNEDREGVESLPTGTLLTEPEDGAVFRRNKKKAFLRVSEAHKYSEEVTELVKSFASVIKEDASRAQELRSTAERIFKKLDQLRRIRELTEMFHKIYNNHPNAPF